MLLTPLSRSLLAASALLAALVEPAVGRDELDAEPIRYYSAPTTDAVAKLQEAIDSGRVRLDWDERWGWLPAVLDELQIDRESQMLVFSKTSLQVHKISPRRPRALYYNDDAYVGWVQRGDVLEVTAVDPINGPIFYTLKQRETETPRFKRDTGHCLSCHHNRRTRDVPGLLVRSVYPDDRGHALSHLGGDVTDPTTPLENRYGGWYVTGDLAGASHRGNTLYTDPKSDPEASAEPTPLEPGKSCNLKRYLTRDSDLVALMVLEHQSQMHNAITRASYEGRRADAYNQTWGKMLEKPEGFEFEVSISRLDRAAEQLLECLLFSGEQALPGPVAGSSGFTTSFQEAGLKDATGRSLRDFDLQSRLFKHPCSYLIHSESFAALPEPILKRVSRRLGEVLGGEDRSPAFAHLTGADRQAIARILSETKAPVEIELP